MQAIPAAAKANPPLISGGYTKINLFGEDMVTSCGVAARALAALAKVNAEVVLITTSDLDISLLIHQEDEDVALNALNKALSCKRVYRAKVSYKIRTAPAVYPFCLGYPPGGCFI